MSLANASSDPAERHDAQVTNARIVNFLAGEFAKRDVQACESVDLMYSPGNGHKDEHVREWVRANDPDRFDPANIPDFVSSILDLAEWEANAKDSGRHRFFIRTTQLLRCRQVCSFAIHNSGVGPVHRGYRCVDVLLFDDCLGLIDVAIGRALRHPDVNHDDIARRLKTGLSGLPKTSAARKAPR